MLILSHLHLQTSKEFCKMYFGHWGAKEPFENIKMFFWGKLKTVTTRFFPSFQKSWSVSSACNTTHSPLIHSVPQKNAIQSIFPKVQYLTGIIPDPVVLSKAALVGVPDPSFHVLGVSVPVTAWLDKGRNKLLKLLISSKYCIIKILYNIDTHKWLNIYIYKN